MPKFQDILQGGDLRSIGKANEVVALVKNQTDFDELFPGLSHPDRKVVMRTADAIEKITLKNPDFLQKHKKALLKLCQKDQDIELKWHLALLLPRLSLTPKELQSVWNLLTLWARNAEESKIVRVNSIQGLFELLSQLPGMSQDFEFTLAEMEKENIASIHARIRKIRKLR